MGFGAVCEGEWLWNVALCLGVSVGCGAVCEGEWLWNVALCLGVSGCGIWRCV